MFAVLEHRQGDAVHWDLLVQIGDEPRLRTWRLADDPTAGHSPIAAEPIAAHRRRYLDYQGPISGGRGSVRRVDRGSAAVEALTSDELRLVLHGHRLDGRYRIITRPDGARFECLGARAAVDSDE